MLNYRLVSFFIIAAVVVLVGLTISEASATSIVISQPDSAWTACSHLSMTSKSSTRSEYVAEQGVWVTYTEDGPTGRDGGLIHLLSNRRSCSQ